MTITDKLTLTCEDNMEMMSRYPDNFFQVAIVDPPYFSGPDRLGYYGKRKSATGVTRGGYKKIGTWDLPDQKYFNELFRVSKHQIIWGINYYAKFVDTPGRIVWDKCNGASSFSDAEIASCSKIESVRLLKYMWNGMCQGSDFSGTMQGNKKLNEKRIHPTQKPVAVYKWLLEKYAEPGDNILDTHLGSMSLAIACHDYGFNLHGCEIDPKIYKDGIKRVQNHIKQIKLF